MQDEKNLPSWQRSARQTIPKLGQHWRSIQSEARADIRRGLEISRIAEKEIRKLDYLDRTLNQSMPTMIVSDPVVLATGGSVATTLTTYENFVGGISGQYTDFGLEKGVHYEQLMQSLSYVTATSGSMLYGGAQIEQRIQSRLPDYQPQLHKEKTEYMGSREQLFDDLSNLLRQYDPQYTQMLYGSEEALEKRGHDSLTQAAHSMRDLFQQIMEHLAPTEVVRTQPWFRTEPTAPGGVSRLLRLRYIVYGSGTHLDRDQLLVLDDSARSAKEALDLCIARAHNHDPELTKSEVQLAIDQARDHLRWVLEKYEERRRGTPG